MAAEPQKTRSRQPRARQGEPEVSEQAKERRTEFLTAQQLAEVLQVSESTIHRLRRAGRIPAILVTDRIIRFNLRDVQKALRPTASARAQVDGGEGKSSQEPDPQLAFEDFFSDFSS